jgi:hypothetical protein
MVDLIDEGSMQDGNLLLTDIVNGSVDISIRSSQNSQERTV